MQLLVAINPVISYVTVEKVNFMYFDSYSERFWNGKVYQFIRRHEDFSRNYHVFHLFKMNHLNSNQKSLNWAYPYSVTNLNHRDGNDKIFSIKYIKLTSDSNISQLYITFYNCTSYNAHQRLWSYYFQYNILLMYGVFVSKTANY